VTKFKEWLSKKQNIIIISTLVAIPLLFLFALFFSEVDSIISREDASIYYEFAISAFVASLVVVFAIGTVLNKIKWKIVLNIIFALLNVGAILSFFAGNFKSNNLAYPIIVIDTYILSYWIVNFFNQSLVSLKNYIKREKLTLKEILSVVNKIIIGVVTIVSSILASLLVLKQLLS
jgi:uncharacterized protein (DUF2062 family)